MNSCSEPLVLTGMSSLMYHLHRPTMVKEVGKSFDVSPKAMVSHNIKSRLLKGFEVKPMNDFLESRTVMLFNSDVHVSLLHLKNL